MSKLCAHVELSIDKDSKVVTVIRGAVFPYFGWSRKLQADTPRLRCSECSKYVQIKGYIVKRSKEAMYIPRQEKPHGKTATRKRISKQDKTKTDKLSWG